jgi:hypothetical protein
MKYFVKMFLWGDIGGFMLLMRRPQTAFGWLVLCSLFFCGWWKPVYPAK